MQKTCQTHHLHKGRCPFGALSLLQVLILLLRTYPWLSLVKVSSLICHEYLDIHAGIKEQQTMPELLGFVFADCLVHPLPKHLTMLPGLMSMTDHATYAGTDVTP